MRREKSEYNTHGRGKFVPVFFMNECHHASRVLGMTECVCENRGMSAAVLESQIYFCKSVENVKMKVTRPTTYFWRPPVVVGLLREPSDVAFQETRN